MDWRLEVIFYRRPIEDPALPAEKPAFPAKLPCIQPNRSALYARLRPSFRWRLHGLIASMDRSAVVRMLHAPSRKNTLRPFGSFPQPKTGVGERRLKWWLPRLRNCDPAPSSLAKDLACA